MKTSKLYGLFLVLALALSMTSSVSASGTVTIKPSALNGWGFLLETGASGAGNFVNGPAVAPLNNGSVHFTTGSTSDGILVGLSGYAGTKLSDITTFQYSTYQALTSTSTVQTSALQFAIDNDVTDADFGWKGRLIFEPYYTETVVKGSWQTWDPMTQGKWWGTHSSINFVGGCSIASPCTWIEVLTKFPNAGIHGVFGAVLFKAGSGWPAGFDGNVDAFTIGVSGSNTTYDFEPETPCTTVCYADAVNGNDSFGGDTPASAKKTIQAALDAVSVNGTVRVLPGNYSETATNRWVLGTNGPHQFGLFMAKDGVTIQGVTAGDVAITDYNALGAYMTTNATNNFGTSGIFVEGDNVTIAGLRIGPNTAGDNKTIEIIGDGFTLKDSHVDVPGGGSVYFNDWQFDVGPDTSHVQSYTVDHNLIDQSTSIDISSGAGYSGSVLGRQITNNEFENNEFWPSISFNGSGTGVPWFVQSVGGAVIENNTFINTFNGNDVRAGHIRVRGVVDVSQFDWTAYWNNNTFNKAVVILDGAYPPFNVRQYNYTSGSYSFDVRRIGVNIQGSIDKAVAGDTVLVKDGVYAESPNITKPITLKSWSGRDVTTIQLQSGPTYLGALTVDTAGTTVVDGFTIVGFDAVGSGLASSNIVITTLPDDVTIQNNRIKVGLIGAGSNGDDGMGLVTYYNTASDVDSLNVSNNIFEPLNASGTRAFYINPGVDEFVFFQNQVTGNFTRTAITQAKDGTVEENTLTGVGPAGSRSRGFGTWGYPDPAVYGHTTFRNNTISGVNKGIAVFETNDVVVENNFFVDNDVAVWIGDSAPLTFNPATIFINENSIVNSDLFGTQNTSAYAGTVNAETNWWGSNLPANVAAEVSGDVDFTPWLCSGTDTSAAPGFQPSLVTGCYQFTGFFQPVDMNALNIAKAGQAIPVKWRLLDGLGLPISNPASFVGLYSYSVSCSDLSSTPPDVIETYSGSSGLQYSGDGYWQFNWKTPKSYAGTCRKMYVLFQGGLKSPEVVFQFK